MKSTGQSALLKMVQDGKPMTLGQQLRLTVGLSIPAIISQISSILMQFIDASMVGSLGAEASASIGLVSTTTWLFAGISVACATGFYVQVSHLLGSKDSQKRASAVAYDVHDFQLGRMRHRLCSQRSASAVAWRRGGDTP